MSRAGYSTIAGSGKVATPLASLPRRETYTDTSVSDKMTLATQLSRAQSSAQTQAQQAQSAFSAGSKLIKDIQIVGTQPFKVVHNLNRRVNYIAVRWVPTSVSAGGSGVALWQTADDANSVTLTNQYDGVLTLLMF